MAIEAGLKMDAQVAEKVMGWRRIRPPMWDYDGALPEQGDVLVSPTFDPESFAWPTRGIVPLTYFLPASGRGWSEDIAAAWPVVEYCMVKFGDVKLETGWHEGIAAYPIWTVTIIDRRQGHEGEYRITARTAPLAICLAALKACGAPG